MTTKTRRLSIALIALAVFAIVFAAPLAAVDPVMGWVDGNDTPRAGFWTEIGESTVSDFLGTNGWIDIRTLASTEQFANGITGSSSCRSCSSISE